MIRTIVLLLLTAPITMAQATFHGDAARTGVYQATGPMQLNGTKWTFKTDGPIIGSPAVAGGVVYIGSTDGNLYAVDQETGKQKWKFKTFASRQVTSSPTIANGLVYFGGFDGILYAVDAQTGAVKWTFVAEYERRFEGKRLHGYPSGFQTMDMVLAFYRVFSVGAVWSSPVVDKGVVYFGSTDGSLYAIH